MHSHHHHHHCHAASRGEGGRGPQSGRPEPHPQRDDFTRGRKFSSDDLQLMLLSLLAGGGSHGYELIKALDQRSAGFYSPSPGMVYPALTYLQELGLADVTADGNKKSYSLAPAGRTHLATHQRRADELFAGLAHMARKMAYLRGAIAEEAGGLDGTAWLPEFVEARRGLKRALLMKSEASQPEQLRIAAILLRATQEIDAAAPPSAAPAGPAA